MLPLTAPFDSRAEAPQPLGLVGAHRSRRVGRRHRVRRHPAVPAGGPAAADQLAGLAAHRRAARGDGARGGGHRRPPRRRRAGRPRPVGRHRRQRQQPGPDRAGRGRDRRAPRPRRATGWRCGWSGAGREQVGYGSGRRHLRRLLGTTGRAAAGEPRDRRVRGPAVRGHRRHRRRRALADAGRVDRHGHGRAGRAAGSRCSSSTRCPRTPSPAVADGTDPVLADLAWRMRQVEREQVLGRLAALGCPVVRVARPRHHGRRAAPAGPARPAAPGAGPMIRRLAHPRPGGPARR